MRQTVSRHCTFKSASSSPVASARRRKISASVASAQPASRGCCRTPCRDRTMEEGRSVGAGRRLVAHAARRMRFAEVRNDLHGRPAEARAEIVGMVEHGHDAFVARAPDTARRVARVQSVVDDGPRTSSWNSLGREGAGPDSELEHGIQYWPKPTTLPVPAFAQRLPIGARAAGSAAPKRKYRWPRAGAHAARSISARARRTRRRSRFSRARNRKARTRCRR